MIRGLSPAHDLLTVTSLFAPSTPIFFPFSLQKEKKAEFGERAGHPDRAGAGGKRRIRDIKEPDKTNLPRFCTLITFQ